MEKVNNKKVLSFNGRNDKSYTKEEAWLATEKIVYDIIYKHIGLEVNESEFMFDELLSISYLAFIKAYNKYDINKGILFTSYAYNSIQQEILNYIRDENRRTDQYDLTLNNLIIGDHDNTEIMYTLPNENYNVESEGIIKVVIYNYIKTLNKDKHKQIINLFLEGQMQSDIYKQLNCSKEMVRQAVKKLRNYIRKEMEVNL